ncbi:MAG: putative aminohydrolase SsnA [Candidatus Heimdallarchaeota archaeon]|nr:putative aminohydrolase SsnA [Candidatus Heimdallarchaeota archaeon]
MSIIIKNGYLITHDEKNRVIKDGALYLDEDLIKDLGSTDEIVSKYPEVDMEIDADGRVVMPGLINAHMHFYSAFATGMPLEPFPPGFVEVLENLWWKLDRALLKEDVYYSALLGYIQAVRSGTTTVIDHHASPSYISGSLNQIEKAGRELGVRSNLCYEVTDRNGKDGANEGLKENENYIRAKQKEGDDMFSGLLGLHASFTVDKDTLDHASQIVSELDTGIHSHLDEGTADMEHAKREYNMTTLQRFNSHDLLNEKAIFAHGIYMSPDDYNLLASSGANLTHQPRSNMNNAVGMLNLETLLEHDVQAGLGTDGMSADMKAEVMSGPLLQKHHRKNNTVGFIEPYNALIYQNPVIVQKTMGVKVGKLIAGYKADVMISDYRPKTPVNSDNTAGHFMFGVINEPVHSTIINGDIRMLNHLLVGVNENEIHEKARELAEGVWKRVQDL